MNPWKLKAKFTKLGKRLTQEFVGMKMTAVVEAVLLHRANEIADELGIVLQDMMLTMTYLNSEIFKIVVVPNGQN